MTSIPGTYYRGKLKLSRPYKTIKPVRVTVIFEEDSHKKLSVSDFSFLETQELLKDYDGSFSDEVIEERRKAV